MDRDVRWRTQQSVERVTDAPVEAVRIVEQFTTGVGAYFGLAVTTADDRLY